MADEQTVTARSFVFSVNNKRLTLQDGGGKEYESPGALPDEQVRQLAKQLVNLVSPAHTAIVYVVDGNDYLVRPVLPSAQPAPGVTAESTVTALTTGESDMMESALAEETDSEAASEEPVISAKRVVASLSDRIPDEWSELRELVARLEARVRSLENARKKLSATTEPESESSGTQKKPNKKRVPEKSVEKKLPADKATTEKKSKPKNK
jgi:hypothetical protein